MFPPNLNSRLFFQNFEKNQLPYYKRDGFKKETAASPFQLSDEKELCLAEIISDLRPE
jgi:hypothetical protein